MSAISPTTRRWMSPPIYESAHSAREGTALRPYLTLPYILSLTWLAYPIISVLFVAFRLQISSASAQNAVSDGKSNLLTSCSAAEKAATVAASLPRYMAIGTNKQIAEAVNGTMSAARATLVLALSILEAVINFAIDIYRSTFFCFLELVVRGGLSVLISAVDEINSFLTSTFSSIRTTIQSDITSINSAIQSAVNAINDVNPFSKISAPQFSVPDLSSLSNVTLPSSVEDALTTLNSSLPTIDQIKNSIADVVDTPFEALKADINNTFAGLNFNESTLYVPEQQTLSFCGDMDTSVVDDLGHDLLKITKIGVIILVLLAVLLLGAHCALEWYKWRCLQQHLEYTRQAWTTDPTMDNAVKSNGAPSIRMTNHNLLVLAGTLQHPLLTRISNQLAALLRLSPSQHTNLQWFFHYVFHPPALACFLIGFLGLLSVELQLIAIHPLEAKYASQVATSVSDFSNTIATSINASMYNQSATYANQINSMVDSTQSTINDGLFGWVNGTTTMLNDTLVTFYSDVQNAVSTIFNGTVLEDPIQEFVRCIIGTKIEAIEEALTFLHNNLAIDIPRLNDSVLVLSQANVNEATQPIAEAAVGNGTDGSQGLVGKIVASYVASLEKERIMFIVFVGLWGLVVLIALLIILYHSYAKPAIDARRQRKSDHPFTSDAASTYPAGKATNDLSFFTRRSTPIAERSFNVSSPTGRQSLRNLDAVDQRSWDGLLDFSTQNDNGPKQSLESPAEKALKKKKSPPRKLVAIGKKASEERFISDEERIQVAEANGAEDEAKEVSWMKKLTNAFHKKGSDDGFGFSSVPRGSSNPRPRPKLTIATNTANMGFAHVARDQLPADGGSPARSPRIQNDPPSAWSASPNPPRALPWLLNPLSTAGKQPKSKPNMLGLPLSPHRNVSAPVDSAYGPPVLVDRGSNVNAAGGFAMPAAPVSAATVTPAAQTSFSAVPSYYLTLPLHAGRDSLLPENTLATRGAHPHKRSSSVPLQKLAPSVIEAHHGSRQPAASHVRHGSVAVDPFRTPFDDDARVIPEQPRDAATHANPFSPVVF